MKRRLLTLAALRAQIKAGLDELECGDFTEVAEEDLVEYLEGFVARSGKGAR